MHQHTTKSIALLASLIVLLLSAHVSLAFPTARMVQSSSIKTLLEESITTDNLPTNTNGVIFDIDGTLADSWKLGFDVTAVILQRHSIPHISEELYHECTKFSTPERLARHAGLEPGDSDFEPVGKALANEFDDLCVGMVSASTAGFFPGIGSLLQRIQQQSNQQQILLGALTNSCDDYAHAILKVNSQALTQGVSTPGDNHYEEIYTSFKSIRGADNVPAPKPAPDGLWQVCQDLNIPPSCCVYVGDSPSDAVAALAAGMPSIGVLWGSHGEESLKKAPFSHICRTVDELQSLLTTMGFVY